MADLGFKFKPEEVQDSQYEPVPVGDYVCMITESEMKETKAGTGKYIQMNVEIVEGEYQGRKLIERLNIQNPNQKAVEIAFSNP